MPCFARFKLPDCEILITGAAGLVGSHLARRMARDPEVTALKHADLDITDPVAIDRYVAAAQPALIFNCAVLQVDDCEQHPDRARAINVEGPRLLAEAAQAAQNSFTSARNTPSRGNRWVGRLTRSKTQRSRSMFYGETKSAARRLLARRASAAISFARHGCSAAARRAFFATCTRVSAPGKKFAPSMISGPAQLMSTI